MAIKRKKSFGSKTQKGADIMSVLYSAAMSLWHRGKEEFFANYQRALSGRTLDMLRNKTPIFVKISFFV